MRLADNVEILRVSFHMHEIHYQSVPLLLTARSVLENC